MPTAPTSLSLLGALVTAAACLLMLILPRRHAIIPMIVLACYLSMGDNMLIFGLNFSMIRVLTLVGWARLLVRGEFHVLHSNKIDKVFLAWICTLVIFNTIQGAITGHFSDNLKWVLGFAYNAIGLYFLFRRLIRYLEDIRWLCKATAILLVPVALLMLVEMKTGYNSFAIFGGVSPITIIRNGQLRAHGPFAHPILAGSFGATLMPLLAANWWSGHKGKALCDSGHNCGDSHDHHCGVERPGVCSDSRRCRPGYVAIPRQTAGDPVVRCHDTRPPEHNHDRARLVPYGARSSV